MGECERCGKGNLLGCEMVFLCKKCASGVVESAPSASANTGSHEIARLEKILFVAKKHSGTIVVTDFIETEIAQLRAGA